MVQKIASSDSLRDKDTRSLAVGSAAVIRSICGRIRILAETIEGRSIVAGEEAAADRNGQGLVGVDLSGPPFGPCLPTALWWCGGMKPDTSGAGEWGGQRGGHLLIADGAARDMPISLYNRGHSAYRGAPLSRGYLTFTVYRTSSAATANLTLRCQAQRGDDSGREQTFTLANNTNEQSFTATTAFWDLAPGLNKNLGLRLSTTAPTNVVLVRASMHPAAKVHY